MTRKWKNRLSQQIINTLFPPRCLICDAQTHTAHEICDDCLTNLPFNQHCCYQCALPLPQGQNMCGHCIQSPPHFDQMIAPLLYKPPIDTLITRLKFSHKLNHAQLLCALIEAPLTEAVETMPELIIPVPLHQKRQQDRGYNQALEILKPLAESMSLPISNHIAYRQRETELQSRLKAKERHKNMKNAFTIQGDQLPQHIAIFDDVVTTTSTVKELAIALKKAGVQRVDVWAVARAIHH